MTTLKEALKGKLTEKQLLLLVKSFDVIGSIAIIEIPKELEKKEKLIAETLLNLHKNILTVAKKVGIHKGVFRTQNLKIIAGEKKKESEYKENNVRLKLNAEKVYFSPRLGTERKRVMEQVKKGENVLVMFSGCAPYVCVIAKNTKAKEIVGVEINPTAHKYAEENLKLNKISNARLYLGDVRDIVPKLKEKFDRIAMPLPKGGEDFIDIAIGAAKKGAIIHFYDFLHADSFGLAKEKVKSACKKAKKKCKISKTVKCGQFGPRIFRICVDFKVM
jgi:tRNA (guanine37-N1)-methyltransferase